LTLCQKIWLDTLYPTAYRCSFTLRYHHLFSCWCF